MMAAAAAAIAGRESLRAEGTHISYSVVELSAL